MARWYPVRDLPMVAGVYANLLPSELSYLRPRRKQKNRAATGGGIGDREESSGRDFSGHAVRQMFARGITRAQVTEVAQRGKIIIDYPDDTPYPSALLLGFADGTPIHAVVAWNPADGACIVVTVYIPDPDLWTDDFEKRKTP